LHASVVESILKWRNGRSSCWLLFTGKNKRVFPSHFQRACRRITQEVYGYSYRFHALRHTFAMKVYARTHDLLLVKKLLGHNFVTSTQIYAEALDDTPTDLLFNLNISSSVGVEASSVGSTSVTQCKPKAIQELYKPPIGGLPVASMLAGRWSGVDN
jgi:hypothetical protein